MSDSNCEVSAELSEAGERSGSRRERHLVMGGFDRVFFRFSALLLLAAAAMKVLALVVDFPGTGSRDPILWFLPSNLLQVLLIGLELWVAIFVVSRHFREYRYLALLLLSCGFLGYRLSKWYHFRDSSCDCLGSVFARWGGGSLEPFAMGVAVLLFLVPIGVLIDGLVNNAGGHSGETRSIAS